MKANVLVWTQFIVCALVIAAAVRLPHLGEEVAEMTGLGRTFVGTVFIALSTSLYTKGALLSHIAGAHAITANAAIVMTAIAVIGMTYRAGKKRFRFAWDSVGIMAVYATAMLILYLFR